MTVQITPDQETIVREFLSEGEYASELQVIDAALIALRRFRMLQSAIAQAQHDDHELLEEFRRFAAALRAQGDANAPATLASPDEGEQESIPERTFDECLDRVIKEWGDVLKRLA